MEMTLEQFNKLATKNDLHSLMREMTLKKDIRKILFTLRIMHKRIKNRKYNNDD